MLNSKKIGVLVPTVRPAVFRFLEKKRKYHEKKLKTVYGALRVYPVKTATFTVKRCGAIRALATF